MQDDVTKSAVTKMQRNVNFYYLHDTKCYQCAVLTLSYRTFSAQLYLLEDPFNWNRTIGVTLFFQSVCQILLQMWPPKAFFFGGGGGYQVQFESGVVTGYHTNIQSFIQAICWNFLNRKFCYILSGACDLRINPSAFDPGQKVHWPKCCQYCRISWRNDQKKFKFTWHRFKDYTFSALFCDLWYIVNTCGGGRIVIQNCEYLLSDLSI